MNVDMQPPNDESSDPASEEIAQVEQLPSPGGGSTTTGAIARFLEDIYGTLFTPAQAFASLRSRPSAIGGVCVLVLVNVLESIRTGRRPSQIVPTVVAALVGWLIFSLLLQRLATVFQRQIDLNVLLSLTAFASLPWIFIGPALSLRGEWGTSAALVVMLWFIVWQVWAASVAIAVSAWRLALLVPLAIAGGFVALIWTGNSVSLLLSIAGY
ncbi:YIP1 family protein [Pseudanabaena sp. PCC 6802]|uniref:YIP1 family protein n=1 Tax=Pseudanabaena sp. PCC 6802 TaxID=118173 RepID=UPI000344C6F0|nr:YIP1 family protein [Pseudanabaena sp. PCC 6802]